MAFIYREDYYKPDDENAGIAEIILAKQRNGPTGTVKLAFLKEFTRFENYFGDLGMSEDLRYPIGEFDKDFEMTPELRREFIDTIAACPAGVRKAVEGLSDEQLDTPYRPGRLDRPADRSSHSRQPSEFLLPL